MKIIRLSLLSLASLCLLAVAILSLAIAARLKTRRNRSQTSKDRPAHTARTPGDRKNARQAQRATTNSPPLTCRRRVRLGISFQHTLLRTQSIVRWQSNLTITMDLKLRTKLQLTNHRFNEALETTQRLQTFRNDDHDVWGMITDALVETGDYAGAVQAAQRMIDLRPDSSSYARVSNLRRCTAIPRGQSRR